MSSSSFSRHIEEDARLVILSELYRQSDGRLNSGLVALALEAAGHSRSSDWITTQLRKMQELGAITLTDAGPMLIAQITGAGVDHVLRPSRIEGIKQPALGV